MAPTKTRTVAKTKASADGGTSKTRGGGVRKEKDPNAPKRGSNAFIFFGKEVRPLVKAQQPDLANTDLLKAMGAMWKEMDAAAKAKYEKMAQEDKARYQREMEEYERS